MEKWSDKIFILNVKPYESTTKSYGSEELVVFPTDSGANYYLLCFNLSRTSDNTAKQERNIDSTINYRTDNAAVEFIRPGLSSSGACIRWSLLGNFFGQP